MIVLREVARKPLRTALSAFGMAGAIALVILGNFAMDSIDQHFDDVVRREQREDLSVTFMHPLSRRAVDEIARQPGVLLAEESRNVPVRIRFDHVTRDSVLVGLPEGATLRQVVERGNAVGTKMPSDGVLATKVLGEILGVRVGDRLEIELREGDRRVVHPVVAGFVDEVVGINLYASTDVVAALERDLGAVSGAHLAIDRARRATVESRLARSPRIIDIGDLGEDIARLRSMNGEAMNVWSAISISMAVCVIFGVVYNNARIALASRSRDLASLRVLGLSRREISSILIGGLAIEVLLAIPLGLFFGRVWSQFFMSNIDREAFRWTVFITPKTYAIAALVAAASAAASALWVRRNLDHLDLIAVLKTRE